MKLDISPITADIAEKINTARLISHNNLSSHAFQSLYYWRNQMQLSVICEDDWFAVKCNKKGNNTWFFPCGNPDKTKAFITEKSAEKDFKLCYISDTDKEVFEKDFPGVFNFSEVPNDFEYIYDIKGQLELCGGKYANIRTQVHKIERDFSPTVKELSGDTLSDALFVIDEWEKGIHGYDDSVLSDDGVDKEMLNTAAEFGFVGCVVYLDGVPEAVSAGFPIDGETFDMALSKTAHNIQGLSYYSKREVMKRLSPECKYMNLEEDLGIPGLQNMKKSMNPVKMNRIWEAELI